MCIFQLPFPATYLEIKDGHEAHFTANKSKPSPAHLNLLQSDLYKFPPSLTKLTKPSNSLLGKTCSTEHRQMFCTSRESGCTASGNSRSLRVWMHIQVQNRGHKSKPSSQVAARGPDSSWTPLLLPNHSAKSKEGCHQKAWAGQGHQGALELQSGGLRALADSRATEGAETYGKHWCVPVNKCSTTSHPLLPPCLSQGH